MSYKTQIVDSLIDRLKAVVTHVDAQVNPIAYINPTVPTRLFICPVVEVLLIMDNKNKLLSDVIIITESIDVSIIKSLAEIISITNEIISLGINKNLEEFVNSTESIDIQIIRIINETAGVSDRFVEYTNTVINAAALNTHALLQGADSEFFNNMSIAVTKNLIETVINSEIIFVSIDKILEDSASSGDTSNLQMNKVIADSAGASDQILQDINVEINTAPLNTHALLEGNDTEFVDNIVIRLN